MTQKTPRKSNKYIRPPKPEPQVCICIHYIADPEKLPNPPCAGCPRNTKKEPK